MRFPLCLEVEPHKFVAEASELGFRPYEWPDTIPTNLGNKQPFVRCMDERQNGELVAVQYRQQLGCITLRVFND
jgi:hypothetical protein